MRYNTLEEYDYSMFTNKAKAFGEGVLLQFKSPLEIELGLGTNESSMTTRLVQRGAESRTAAGQTIEKATVRLFESWLPPELLDLKNSLEQGYCIDLPKHDIQRILVPDFDAPHGYDVIRFRTQSNALLATTAPLHVPVDAPGIDKWVDWARAQRPLADDIVRVRKLLLLLDKCTTWGQIYRIWPASTRFMPERIAERVKNAARRSPLPKKWVLQADLHLLLEAAERLVHVAILTGWDFRNERDPQIHRPVRYLPKATNTYLKRL
jgi:hypothetical protein